MKKLTSLLLLVALSPVFAKPIGHLRMNDVTTQEVLSVFGKLTGATVEHESDLPNLRQSINLASEVDPLRAAAILLEMLEVNGVSLKKESVNQTAQVNPCNPSENPRITSNPKPLGWGATITSEEENCRLSE